MRPTALLLATLSALPLLAQADACIVHSQGTNLDVKVCQQNRSIPEKLFRDGFCQPQLKDQKVQVTFAESCPSGAFGVCENAQVQGAPYRQDIHYYGIASDARILQPFCESQSHGQWRKP
ncbi:NADH:ubiquinone oxidoreductase [Pseudomonas sp. ZM23]|uniref:NADH:ubiquinone oxidoreductase n=1 Tax=Pseudomonas triclosanedens TaxID=2961893 RepID=A0ABY6ZZX6_9PSED|nr:NADH:ubiquinone oxidoreductase [Pseudomonas triclosanedens]MCP8462699.1 NADH:ubiquinone oxidoreductase [Pseudomonas triclosanedens]MCP8468318.1 NADH:ubiquinone oxidoreductase [Pseudomonas triclosanedens]MCP8475077.1 NADH:ubiquinone oxidoreductase [Pseudomonas triclosanedens]WAI49886.1 NADH:ubiquinone oxidoreductase [Pseudomonas triclosanedens]